MITAQWALSSLRCFLNALLPSSRCRLSWRVLFFAGGIDAIKVLVTAAVFERISPAVSGKCGQYGWIELDEGVQNHLYSCQLERNGESYGWYRVVVGGRSVEPEGEGSMSFALPMSSIGTLEVGPFDRAR